MNVYRQYSIIAVYLWANSWAVINLQHKLGVAEKTDTKPVFSVEEEL